MANAFELWLLTCSKRVKYRLPAWARHRSGASRRDLPHRRVGRHRLEVTEALPHPVGDPRHALHVECKWDAHLFVATIKTIVEDAGLVVIAARQHSVSKVSVNPRGSIEIGDLMRKTHRKVVKWGERYLLSCTQSKKDSFHSNATMAIARHHTIQVAMSLRHCVSQADTQAH